MKKLLAILIICSLILLSLAFGNKNSDPYFQFHENLSEYNFFAGKMADLQPADGIVPYDLNTPLFTDYAVKARFIKLPAGKKCTYNDS